MSSLAWALVQHTAGKHIVIPFAVTPKEQKIVDEVKGFLFRTLAEASAAADAENGDWLVGDEAQGTFLKEPKVGNHRIYIPIHLDLDDVDSNKGVVVE